MSSFVCSNLGYALIARVLAEKFANDDYEGWVQRNIFDQLRMTNTGFDLARYLHDHVLFFFLLFWRGEGGRWEVGGGGTGEVVNKCYTRSFCQTDFQQLYLVEMYNSVDHLLFP